jgi:DNA-damage-inducible protein J
MNDKVQSRITPELKRDAERIFRAMGLKTSDAIRLFLQQCVNVDGLPFRPTAARPNAATVAAMLETQMGESLQTYPNFAELLPELDD